MRFASAPLGRLASAAVLSLGLTLGACQSPPLPKGIDAPDAFTKDLGEQPYLLGPNDVVRVLVYGQPEFQEGEYGQRVDPSGRLSIPLAGAVFVAGMTIDEARLAVQGALEPYLRAPSVTLSLMEPSSRRIYLLGQVEDPGTYPLDRPLTALQALSLGGGFRRGANREEVCVLRRVGDRFAVARFNAATPGSDGLIAMRGDDMIFVSQTGIGILGEDYLPIFSVLSTLASLVLVTDAIQE